MQNVIRQDIAPNDSKMTDSFREGMKTARKDISRALVTKLHDEAKAQPLNAGNWKAAVQAYTRAEDEIFKIFDQAKTEADKEMTELAKTHYEQVLMEFNKFAEQTFTAEFMAGMPARELISPAESANWIAANLQGFEKRLSPGELLIVNESERTGIVSIGLQENWRDFLLDVAYTVKKGDAELHVRHGPTKADPAQNPAFDLGPKGILPVPEGVEARFQLQLAGGRLIFRAPGGEPDERNVANKRVKGAIGIAVKAGSSISIRQMTLRLVR